MRKGIAARFWAGESVYDIAHDLYWRQENKHEHNFERFRLRVEQAIRRDYWKRVKAKRTR